MPDRPAPRPRVLCIGSCLWDVVGRSAREMRAGSDVPGRILRLPGGVAMNVAMTLAPLGLTPVLLTAVGTDAPGDELLAAATELGIDTAAVHRSDRPTDSYMAVEGANGLIAAIADAHSLEAAGDAILTPLTDGTLATDAAPWDGLAVLDGNLTEALLLRIATGPMLARADLRVAPASPGKAGRIAPLIAHPRATLYVNLEEAGLLCERSFDDAPQAAAALAARGAHRAIVTNGAQAVAEAGAKGTRTAFPPTVRMARVTGAGDTFMAAHMAREAAGDDADAALSTALKVAADYVAGLA
ncbi:MAG: PfkB family carbohydrate kinase [Paracoccaceae bacterium]